MLGFSHTPDRIDSQTSQSQILPEPTVIFPPSPVASDEKLSLGVARALQLLKDRRVRSLPKDWSVVQLQTGDYEELWWHVERDEALFQYVTTKVHLDYDPKTLQLVVRMISPIHEKLLASTEQDILSQLSTIGAGNGSAAPLAQRIHSLRSSTIYLQDGATHDPDTQFVYEAAKFPGVVIEIAYSQSRKDGGKDLARLADHYIVESSGSINMVIGIAVDYRATKKATISIWCPRYGSDQEGEYLASEQTLVSQEFRRTDGTGVAGKAFWIPLRSFVPQPDQSDILSEFLEQRIVISYEKLAAYLDQAEALYESRKSKQGIQNVLSASRRKRRRKLTPEEELMSDDERKFAEFKAAEAKRVQKRDEEWKEH